MKHFHDLPFEFNMHESYYGSIKPSYIQSDDGINLAYYRFPSGPIPKAIVILIHGAGAHGYMSDYQEIGQAMLHHNIDYYCLDIRGHGNSGGIRGSAASKERVWRDISNVISFIRKDGNDVPIYLAGHSAGAGLVINYATWRNRLECDGYLLISPYLGWRAKSSRTSLLKDAFAKPIILNFMVNMVSFGLLFGNSTSLYYNYPTEAQKMDSLLVTSISCNMSKACTLWNPKRQFKMIRKPIGLFIGSEDELFNPAKVLSYQRLVSKNIQKLSRFEILPGLKHLTILTEIGDYLVKTIEDRLLTAVST